MVTLAFKLGKHKRISQQVKELIAKDKLTDAMKIIIRVLISFNNEHYNTAVLLSRELCNHTNEELRGIVSREVNQITKSNIANRMLQLIDLLEL